MYKTQKDEGKYVLYKSTQSVHLILYIIFIYHCIIKYNFLKYNNYNIN